MAKRRTMTIKTERRIVGSIAHRPAQERAISTSLQITEGVPPVSLWVGRLAALAVAAVVIAYIVRAIL